jgi:hypothetical protein
MAARLHPRDRRFLLWAVGGFPVAFIVLVMWPPVLAGAALVLLLVPADRAPERLGLVQSIAAVALLVGVLNIGESFDPAPWLVGGVALSAVGAARYLAAR